MVIRKNCQRIWSDLNIIKIKVYELGNKEDPQIEDDLKKALI